MADQQEQRPQPPVAAKRPYTAPTLTEYGSVAKLTQSGGTKFGDGGGSKLGSCL